MKLSNKHKAAIKSYLRAVAASGITVALAIVADIHPAYATLLGAVVAKRMDAETRAQFRQDYGSGANIEELSADLMGNAFQDENFLTEVFTERVISLSVAIWLT